MISTPQRWTVTAFGLRLAIFGGNLRIEISTLPSDGLSGRSAINDRASPSIARSITGSEIGEVQPLKNVAAKDTATAAIIFLDLPIAELKHMESVSAIGQA